MISVVGWAVDWALATLLVVLALEMDVLAMCWLQDCCIFGCSSQFRLDAEYCIFFLLQFHSLSFVKK